MISFAHPEYFTNEGYPKEIMIRYSASGTYKYLYNSDLEADSLVFDDSLCTADKLEFGTCLASYIEFNVGANITDLAIGKQLRVDMTVNSYNVRLGYFRITSIELTGNKVWRKVKAYDDVAAILNKEMVDWYNGLFPNAGDTITIKNMRDSFFTYVGQAQETTTLINDDVAVGKTINSTSISGKTIIEAICQINGVFGKINRSGYFKYISLDDAVRTELGANGTYLSAECEEYVTAAIDKVQIRTNENDIGAIVGTGTNALIIENNFLLFGKDSTELTTIATAILNKVSGIVLRPFKAKVLGVPFMEVGDAIRIVTANQTIDSYILRRKMTGIQCLFDEMEAKSTQTREEQLNTTNHSLIMLAYKSNELTRTVEETQSTITQILDPTDPTSLQSQITQNAQAITLKVSKGEVSSEISQEAGQITISSNRLVINSTGFKLDANGKAQFISEDTTNKFVINDVGEQSNYVIRVQKNKSWESGQTEEWADSFSVDKNGIVSAKQIDLYSPYTGTTWASLNYNGITLTGGSITAGNITGSNGSFFKIAVNGSNSTSTFANNVEIGNKIQADIFAFKGSSSHFDASSYAFRIDKSSQYITFLPTEISTTGVLVIKSTNSANAGITIGSTSAGVCLGASAGRISFFGATTVGKKTVNKLTTSATLAQTVTKVNDLLTALKDYGLIASS